MLLFEKMREGIADFEKLKIIQNKAAKSPDPVVKKLFQQPHEHLKIFTAEREFKEECLRE